MRALWYSTILQIKSPVAWPVEWNIGQEVEQIFLYMRGKSPIRTDSDSTLVFLEFGLYHVLGLEL